MSRMLGVTIVAVLTLAPAHPRAQQPAADWTGFEFMMGDFVATGGGAPGEASGATSLHPIMNGVVLERLNRAEYPAANGRPAFTHEDRLYFYRDPATRGIRALYFDPEPHTILYRVTVDPAGRRVQLLSDPGPGEPRYRFTYTSDTADEFDVTFEIAPPDHPDQFAKYVGGKARRVGK